MSGFTKLIYFLNMSHKCANSGKKPWQYPASQTGGGISEVGLHPDREICPVFRIPRVLVQAAVDQVTALGEERNASRNLPVEIDPQVGGKGHFDTAETLRPGCCIQLVVGPFTGALQPDARAERNLAAVVVGGKIAIESRGGVLLDVEWPSDGGQVENRIIEGLGIEEDWLNRYPQELSGGELQRFCIARALGKETRFLIADEISTMRDLITQSQIWNFLQDEVKRREIGLIVVSHSEALLKQVAERKLPFTADKTTV